MNDKHFSLILGCSGYYQNGVMICGETSTPIINFDQSFDLETYESIMNFLDNSCGLFDNVITDWNKIVSIIKILREKFSLINENIWQTLHTWFPIHRKCGAYIKLQLNSEVKNKTLTEENIKPQSIETANN